MFYLDSNRTYIVTDHSQTGGETVLSTTGSNQGLPGNILGFKYLNRNDSSNVSLRYMFL